MLVALWLLFFLFCNVLGVETLRAALTLPFEDALLPAALTIPLIALTAFGATRMLEAWRARGE
jgi:hypothetical protein